MMLNTVFETPLPLCYILVYNFKTKPSFKNLNVFFYQWSIDTKSVKKLPFRFLKDALAKNVIAKM